MRNYIAVNMCKALISHHIVADTPMCIISYGTFLSQVGLNKICISVTVKIINTVGSSSSACQNISFLYWLTGLRDEPLRHLRQYHYGDRRYAGASSRSEYSNDAWIILKYHTCRRYTFQTKVHLQWNEIITIQF